MSNKVVYTKASRPAGVERSFSRPVDQNRRPSFRFSTETSGRVLRENVFRNPGSAYVEVQGCNPTGAFLARFQGHQPPVKPGWRFVRGGGVLYRIGAIKRTGEDSAEVYGGYYEGNLSASGNTYYVVRKDGTWVVERDEEHWIS